MLLSTAFCVVYVTTTRRVQRRTPLPLIWCVLQYVKPEDDVTALLPTALQPAVGRHTGRDCGTIRNLFLDNLANGNMSSKPTQLQCKVIRRKNDRRSVYYFYCSQTNSDSCRTTRTQCRRHKSQCCHHRIIGRITPEMWVLRLYFRKLYKLAQCGLIGTKYLLLTYAASTYTFDWIM